MEGKTKSKSKAATTGAKSQENSGWLNGTKWVNGKGEEFTRTSRVGVSVNLKTGDKFIEPKPSTTKPDAKATE